MNFITDEQMNKAIRLDEIIKEIEMKHFTADGHEIVVGMVCSVEGQKCVVYNAKLPAVVICSTGTTMDVHYPGKITIGTTMDVHYPGKITLWQEPAVKHDPKERWVIWYEDNGVFKTGENYFPTLEAAKKYAKLLKPYAIAKWGQPFSEGENL